MTTIVVGSGPVGLAAARALAVTGADVLVIDRIPVIGGMTGWEDPAMRELADDAVTAGARFELGVTACRWNADEGLLVAGPTGVRMLAAERLVFCGGRRPATVAELGIGGDRPAGVIASSVAKHLLESGAILWKAPAVIGSGYDAAATANMLTATGVEPTRIGTGHGPFGNATVQRILGRPRVERIIIDCAGETTEVACDAAILAADDRAVRNVAGAISDDAAGVTYIQPEMRIPTAEAITHAAQIATPTPGHHAPAPAVPIKEQAP